MKADKRKELLGLLQQMSQPRKHGLSQEQLEQTLIDFCAGCPDPSNARWLVVECLDPLTDDELVDRALSMPSRAFSEIPIAIVPASHPARTADRDA